MLSPETIQAAVTFLISVGTLAASELKERWTLRRKEQNRELDLSTHTIDEQNLLTAVEDILASQAEEEVKRTLDLIQRKQKLVFDAKRGKLSAEADHNEGRITSHMLELSVERHNKQIREKLAEIESDLKSLGLQIEKRSL